jgi:hypothetical protein
MLPVLATLPTIGLLIKIMVAVALETPVLHALGTIVLGNCRASSDQANADNKQAL